MTKRVRFASGPGSTGMIDVKNLYEKNQDFKRYVDAIAKERSKPVDEILQHELIRTKAEDYKDEMEQR